MENTNRKILYSPGYGAGWTSWNGDLELQKFMLEYQPFIDFLEAGNSFKPIPFDGGVEYLKDGNTVDWGKTEANLEPIVFTFCKECWERFGDVPYLGGLRDLTVANVTGRVRIYEYDGSESYEEEDSYEGWM